MKTNGKLMCLLMLLVMLVSFAAGCQMPTGDAELDAGNDASSPQNATIGTIVGSETTIANERCTDAVVLDFEQWLNGKLAELGYPLTVTFFAPNEDGYCMSETAYNGVEQDVYTGQLYFYLRYDGADDTIYFACASAKETASEEVFAAHQEISRVLPAYFNTDITAAQVDEVFAVKPDANAESCMPSQLPCVDTYVDSELFLADYCDVANCEDEMTVAFSLWTELDTGHIWFFAYQDFTEAAPAGELDTQEPCTLPVILELQEVINTALTQKGYPLECDFVDEGNIRARFRYTGEGKDVYTPHFYLYADMNGEDTAISYFSFDLGNDFRFYTPESFAVFKDVSYAVSAHFFPYIPTESVELMFSIESQEAGQNSKEPYIFTTLRGDDEVVFSRNYGDTDSTLFRLNSMEKPKVCSFECFPQRKRTAINLRADEFKQRLEAATEARIDKVAYTTEGYMEMLRLVLSNWQSNADNHVNVDMHYSEHSGVLNKLLISIYNDDNLPETQQMLAQTVADILSVCDPDMDTEAFAAFCAPFCVKGWSGSQTDYYDFTYNNISCRFFEGSVTSCEISFLAKNNGKDDSEETVEFTDLPDILELQGVINDICEGYGYPFECMGFTLQLSNNYVSVFRYFGEGVDVYGSDRFSLHAITGHNGDTLTDIDFPVWAGDEPEDMEAYRNICKAIAAYYLPDADMEKMDMLFSTTPDFTPNYTCQVAPDVSAYMYEFSDSFICAYKVGRHRVYFATYTSGGCRFEFAIPYTAPLSAAVFVGSLHLDVLPEGYGFGYSSYRSVGILGPDGNTVAYIDQTPGSGPLEFIDINSGAEPELIPMLFATAVSVWDEDADSEVLTSLCKDAMQTISNRKNVFYYDDLVECYVVLMDGVPHCVIEFLVEPTLDL